MATATKLPVLGATNAADLDIDAALAAFEEEERRKLGLAGDTEHWVYKMVDPQFSKSQRGETTGVAAVAGGEQHGSHGCC